MGYQAYRIVQPSQALDIVAAANAQPTLARIAKAAQASAALWQSLSHLVPGPMRSLVLAGPLDEKTWCLIAANSAAAAKLRHIQPTLLAACQQRGLNLETVRIKVAGKLSN